MIARLNRGLSSSIHLRNADNKMVFPNCKLNFSLALFFSLAKDTTKVEQYTKHETFCQQNRDNALGLYRYEMKCNEMK